MSIRPYLLYLPALSALLLACESRQPATQAGPVAGPAADSSRLAPSPATRVATDTASPSVPLPRTMMGDDDGATRPAVRLDGQLYRVETAVRMEPTRRLPVPPEEPPTEPLDSAETAARAELLATAVERGYGYDATFTVRLLAPDGRPRFTTTLRKGDFAAAMGREHVNVSATSAPRFWSYLPQFQALVFLVPFYLDGTDDGGDALLLLDAASGRVRSITMGSWFGDGRGADAVSTDGQVLLTAYDILRADGRRVSLDRPNISTLGTRLINAGTVLAVYDAPQNARQLPSDNARLLDLDGRQIGAFRFRATEAEVGTEVPAAYCGPTRTHYLFDTDAQSVTLIPRDTPTQHRTLRLQQLARFRAPRRPTEARVTVAFPIGGHLTLYTDTLSGRLRYQLTKPTAY